MNQLFSPHKQYTLVYIDDILVFSKTREKHIEHLKKVFKTFKDNGLIISKKKIELGKQYIQFLGTTIREEKIQLQPQIVTKIL